MIRKAKGAVIPVSPVNPIVRSYARISTLKQFLSQLGLEAQEAMNEGYRQRVLPDFTYEGLFTDPFAVSATVPFLKRKAGNELHKRLKRGDHIIFPSVDRAFRDLFDGLHCIKTWLDMGVTVHLVREGQVLSSDNQMGMIFFKILLLVADIERSFVKMRTQAAVAAQKERGGSCGGRPGLYKSDSRMPGGKRPDPYNVTCYQYMLFLQNQGMGPIDVWRRFAKIGLLNSAGREWSQTTIRDWLREKAYEGVDAADWPSDVEMKLRVKRGSK